jgi:hypothetical protein
MQTVRLSEFPENPMFKVKPAALIWGPAMTA